MKKTLSILSLVVMLLLACASCAGAEVAYQKNYFELTLPDGWAYNEARNRYDQSKMNARVFLIEVKEESKGEPDFDNIIFGLCKVAGTDKDSSTWENITIDGQETALLTYSMEAGNTCYITSIRNGSRACYAVYSSDEAASGKVEFLSLLKSFRVRPKNEACFFRYGNAEVKLKNYRTRTVGGTQYLLVELTWRNVGEKPQMYAVNVDVTAYQDGIQLQDGFLLGVNTEVGTSIMPGKELTCTEVFQLRSQTGEITLIVDKLLDFKDEWPSREYNFTLK